MSEPNTAGAQGTTNESTQGTNAANAGTAGNAVKKYSRKGAVTMNKLSLILAEQSILSATSPGFTAHICCTF